MASYFVLFCLFFINAPLCRAQRFSFPAAKRTCERRRRRKRSRRRRIGKSRVNEGKRRWGGGQKESVKEVGRGGGGEEGRRRVWRRWGEEEVGRGRKSRRWGGGQEEMKEQEGEEESEGKGKHRGKAKEEEEERYQEELQYYADPAEEGIFGPNGGPRVTLRPPPADRAAGRSCKQPAGSSRMEPDTELQAFLDLRDQTDHNTEVRDRQDRQADRQTTTQRLSLTPSSGARRLRQSGPGVRGHRHLPYEGTADQEKQEEETQLHRHHPYAQESHGGWGDEDRNDGGDGGGGVEAPQSWDDTEGVHYEGARVDDPSYARPGRDGDDDVDGTREDWGEAGGVQNPAINGDEELPKGFLYKGENQSAVVPQVLQQIPGSLKTLPPPGGLSCSSAALPLGGAAHTQQGLHLALVPCSTFRAPRSYAPCSGGMHALFVMHR
ncbi:hypothetical protein CRUP_002686 [Coryphaenoides rupestris]|nr:hypothetical protein CRUP_002686 [Coryphaenoides rupestris]